MLLILWENVPQFKTIIGMHNVTQKKK